MVTFNSFTRAELAAIADMVERLDIGPTTISLGRRSACFHMHPSRAAELASNLHKLASEAYGGKHKHTTALASVATKTKRVAGFIERSPIYARAYENLPDAPARRSGVEQDT